MRVRLLMVPFVLSAALLGGCTTTNPGATPTPTPTPTTNGLDALSADEILKKATEALDSASSFRAKGTGESDGTAIDVDLVFAGSDAKGTIKAEGSTVEIVAVGGSSYMKADAAFWEMFLPEQVRAMVLPLVAGKYVKVPATSAEGIVPKVAGLFETDKTWTKEGTTTVNGKPAVTVTDGETKVNVSLVGKAYPINVVSKEGTIEFTEIDAGATVSAPPAAEVVDLTSITG